MGLTSQAAAILEAQRLGSNELPDPGGAPQPVAFCQHGAYGAVMFLAISSAGEWMCLLSILERHEAAWEDFTVVHKPWWDPHEAFAEDELIVTGGHSRFHGDLCAEVVVIPGQAASETSVKRAETVEPVETLALGPWRHFIYVGCLDEPGAPVTLVAQRAGAHETVVFEILDAS
jgi:hypothetical protein